VHVVKFAPPEDFEDKSKPMTMLTRFIKERYPKLVEQADHGDVLENAADSGYRSTGVYMIARRGGQKSGAFRVVELDFEVDDYGSISSEFRAITDFPLNYWHLPSMPRVSHGGQRNNGQGRNCSKFYWHCEDNPQMRIGDLSSAANITEDGNTVEFDFNGQRYSIRDFASFEELQQEAVVYGTHLPHEGSAEPEF